MEPTASERSSARTAVEVMRSRLASVRSLLGRIARRVLAPPQRALERAMHPRRHRAARRAVARRAPVKDVVFVCLGNICRSPYAEARLRAELERAGVGDRVRVRSIGFLPPGRPPPEVAVEAAGRRGLDLTGHRSRSLSAAELRAASVIIVMTSKQRRELEWLHGRPDALQLGDLDPLADEGRTVRDPYGKPPEVFDAVFTRIDRAVDTLAGILLEDARSES